MQSISAHQLTIPYLISQSVTRHANRLTVSLGTVVQHPSSWPSLFKLCKYLSFEFELKLLLFHFLATYKFEIVVLSLWQVCFDSRIRLYFQFHAVRTARTKRLQDDETNGWAALGGLGTSRQALHKELPGAPLPAVTNLGMVNWMSPTVRKQTKAKQLLAVSIISISLYLT